MRYLFYTKTSTREELLGVGGSVALVYTDVTCKKRPRVEIIGDKNAKSAVEGPR